MNETERHPKPVESTVLLELDLGDDELIVRQFSDGMVTLEHAEPRLLLNAEQWRDVVDAFVVLRDRLPFTPEEKAADG